MNHIRLAALALTFIISLQAESWPQFRGARGDGTSAESSPPQNWSQTNNLSWKVAIPGEGHSSPIIWNDSVFLTSALPENGNRVLIKVNATTGRIAWQNVVAKSERESMHRENSSASSTAATDGAQVITSFQVGDKVDIRSYDFEGKLQWSAQPLSFSGEHGFSYSPIFYKDLVILDCRQEGEAATIAFDKKNGAIRWKVEPKKRRISHIPPLIIHDGAREQLIVSGSDETASYHPLTGEQIWWCEGPSDVAVAGMAFGDGLLFTTAGYPARTRMAIRVNGAGDVTESGVAWKFQRQASYVPSPVFHEGHLYSVLDEGMLLCFEARTGDIKWQERLKGRFRASLLLADGLIFAMNDQGVTTIVRASPESFQPVATNYLGELCYASPGLSNGRLFIRTAGNLYCIGQPQKL
ncbi:MAG: outer membrane protein assembly factor BamB family protein [Limisphaerales bacterium]